ncbi:MAG: hypothetical protein E3J72_00285 [Planctomycetota bacterium]|nr:MAG: hypothetical protein E3J72_00285 [Planctomycetota bacterium]
MPLKLGITVVVLFAIVIAGMTIFHFRFTSYVLDLDSENPKTRWEAFEYLSNCGEKGVRVIEDFCRRHNDAGWGKRSGDIRVKLKPDKRIYYCEKSDNSVPLLHVVNFEIEVQNLGDNKIELWVDPDKTFLEEVNVEALISNPKPGSNPSFGGRFGGPSAPNVEVESGQSVSGRLLYCLPRLYDFDLPGIYRIQVIYNPIVPRRWGDKRPLPPERPCITSNRICIAVLPPETKK